MKITKRALALIAVLAFSLLAGSVGLPVFGVDMDSLQAKQQQLSADIAENEKKLAALGEEAKATQEYLDLYDQKMADQEELVESLNTQAAEYQRQADELSAATALTEQLVADGISDFRKRLRAMYMSQNDSLASVLAGSNSFYDILAAMEFIERVSERDNELITDLNEQIAGLKIQKTEREAVQTELENTLASANLEGQRLRQTYDEHAETLANEQALIEDYKANGEELERQAEQVEQEIEAFIIAEQKRLEEERKAREAEEARKKAEAEAAGRNFTKDTTGTYTSYSETGFIWPVPTVHNTTDGYGNRWIVEEQRSNFHKGLDITKPGCGGEAIVAAAGGTVIQAGDNRNGYGICVIIDHGNTISTLYAHMQQTVVSVGEVVAQGDTLGYIGSTGNSYGNHLHFEVRVNGQHKDPTAYVSY
jgi:murein DD-endopeptidase MepM/ murein hydrolase activator NlpD